MVKKPTLILLGILIILGAVAWWTQKAQPDFLKADMTATPTTVPSPFTAWKFENTRLIKYRTLMVHHSICAWVRIQFLEY
jgi:hypothetical protein